jgi:p-aminobenzoyl-glutamate transporter AbgT
MSSHEKRYLSGIGAMMPESQMICTRCGTIGWPKRYTPGSFGVELLLFLLFIIPGLIYGVWRLAARKWVCATCMADALVPIDSPTGRALAN